MKSWSKETKASKHARKKTIAPVKKWDTTKELDTSVGNDLDNHLKTLAQARAEKQKSQEIKTAIAERINHLHHFIAELTEKTKNAIDAAMQASVEIGGHVNEMPRGLRAAWLRDNCPGIKEKQIAGYLGIFNTHRKRKLANIDKRFFFLLGMREAQKRNRKGAPDTRAIRSANPNWLVWAGKLSGHFAKLTKTLPLSQWDENQREAVAAQLHPIAEVFQKLQLRQHTDGAV